MTALPLSQQSPHYYAPHSRGEIIFDLRRGGGLSLLGGAVFAWLAVPAIFLCRAVGRVRKVGCPQLLGFSPLPGILFALAACAMILLSGCAGAAEFARGYERELVLRGEMGSDGASPSVEYRISREDAEARRELEEMVRDLIDELNAERLPRGEGKAERLKTETLKGFAK